MGLVFYDTETTGTETWYDQILQFAAIHTDSQFKELDRFEVRCRILPHIVPAPGAMRVTGIRAGMLTDLKFLSHYEMVRQIRAKLLEWSPATFVGFNSIEFDEDLLRQALYKTLHVPYLTNRDGNTRTDVMRMVHACNMFAPGVLTIPLGENGKPSFKLENLARANGFLNQKAHDAMGDVLATIHLAQLIESNAPDVWSTSMRFSKKASVSDYLADERMFCMAEIYFRKMYPYLMVVLGQNPDNNGEYYVFDLSSAPEKLINLSDIQLTAALRKSPKPIRKLKANAAPMLFQADLTPVSCKARSIPQDELEARAEFIISNEQVRDRLISGFLSTLEDYPPSEHIERQIYGDFYSPKDEALMDEFHVSGWHKRKAIVGKFSDPRLRYIGINLIQQERPDLLDKDIVSERAIWGARRLLGHDDEEIVWTTLSTALDEIELLLADAKDEERTFLLEHQEYLLAKRNEADGHLR